MLNAANDNGLFFVRAPNPDAQDRALLFADGSMGRYLPQYFAQAITRALVDYVSDWVWGELEAGPDTDGYWQAWEHCLDFARVRHPTLGECYLWHDQDLWIVPVGQEMEAGL